LSLARTVNQRGEQGNNSVMKPFSLTFKQRMVTRLTGKDAVIARQLALETGLRQQTLSRWLQEASTLPVMQAKRPRRDWSIEEKIRILATASTKEVLRVPKGKRGIPLTAR
jgi:transposase-like protein